METDNEKNFKDILTHARRVSFEKFKDVQKNSGASNPEVLAIKQEMDTVLARFDNPEIWAHPIEFDAAKIMGFVTEIDGDDPSDLTKFAADIRSFIAYLEENVLKNALSKVASEDNSNFNDKVLNALTLTRQSIGRKKKAFKGQGRDLDAVPKFQKMEKEQVTALAAYRIELRNNDNLKSKQTDVDTFLLTDKLIKATTNVIAFLDLFNQFTATVKSKTPTPKNNDSA